MHLRRLSQPAPLRDPSSPAGAPTVDEGGAPQRFFAAGLREIWQFLEQLLFGSKL